MVSVIKKFINAAFDCSTGELVIENLPLREILKQYDTPLYVYSSKAMDEKWQALHNMLPVEFLIYYSMKANPNPALIRHFLSHGSGLEVASGGELYLAMKAGCVPENILFAGPGKRESELEFALSHDIGEIHSESLLEIQRIRVICHRLKRRARIAVRVNPDSGAQGGAMRMGGKAAPFGLDEEQLDHVLDQIMADEMLDFRGLHFYVGTQILDASVLSTQYREALKIAERVAARMQRPLSRVDFGGGLGIPYFSGDAEIDLEKLGQEIQVLMREIRSKPAFVGTQFVLEPGRYLVGDAGVYIVKVNDIKISRTKTFLVVDGGMNHHLAASGNLGQVIKRNFPTAVLNRLSEPLCEKVDIVGPLCTPLDVLARDVEVPTVKVGDWIGIFQSGAYARSASPLGFLSYPSPAEVLVNNGQAALIRRRGTYDDLLNDLILDS